MDPTWPASQVEQRAIDQLVPYANNPRSHSAAQIAQIAASMRQWGWTIPILVDEANTVIAGHGRIEAARQLGFDAVPVMVAKGWSEAQKKAYVIADNRLSENASWDEALLKIELAELKTLDFDTTLTGFDAKALEQLLTPCELTKDDFYQDSHAGSMVEQFLVPPFSVLDSRQGYWQERKRHWMAKGLASETGRDEHLLYDSQQINIKGAGQTSVFDPVLCELLVRWFSPEGGLILDPFAGGSVRGVISKLCGRDYLGLDLREEQVQANRAQAAVLCPDDPPVWQVGDSLHIKKLCHGVKADMLLSCPPYFDLEQYGEHPADLSNMDDSAFLKAYRKIIKDSCSLLKEHCFACFVVSEVRDKNGHYRLLVPETINAFLEAGLHFYNEAILVNVAGSLPVRAGRGFRSSRKLGRMHQNVLIFAKGQWQQAVAMLSDISIPAHEPEDGETT